MDEQNTGNRKYVGYEYKEVFADHDKVSLYLDAYQSFGWLEDEMAHRSGFPSVITVPTMMSVGKISLKLKRDRKIINRMELTRLQRHFEACMKAIDDLERSKTTNAMIISLAIGVVGSAFMVGSLLSIVSDPPNIALCAILAIPALIGWALPCPVYKTLVRRKTLAVNEIIERKYDEIYEICEKGSRLLE